MLGVGLGLSSVSPWANYGAAALPTSVIASTIGGSIQAGASVAGSAASAAAGSALAANSNPQQAEGASGVIGYFVDSLFRQDTSPVASLAPAVSGTSAPYGNTSATTTSAAMLEVNRIFMSTVSAEALPQEDMRYVGQLVAQRTGLAQPAAEQRVRETYARLQARLQDAQAAAKQTADKARKASAYTALWLFISLLIGAFVASLATTYGGHQRDA